MTRLSVAVIGILAGAAGALLLNGHRAPAAEVTVARAPAPAPARFEARGPGWDEDRIAALERRVAEGYPAPSPQGGAAAPTPEAPPDRAALAAQELELHRDLLRRHDAEPRDGAWAAGQETRLRARLEDLRSRAAFELGPVDCRHETCVASLSWESAAKARAALRTVARGAGDECGTRVTMPEDVGPDGRLHADLLLDCSARQ